jgi:hypothetical protein
LSPATVPGNKPQIESTVVTVTREDLTPQTALFVPAANESLFWVAADYRNRVARIITRTRSGTIENQLPIGAMSFDIYQLPLLCRSVQILQDLPLHILLIIPFTSPPGGMSVMAEIAIAGIDTITVPAGTFECQKVIVNLPGFAEEYWIERYGARQLIKYVNHQNGRALMLTQAGIITPSNRLHN